MRSIAYVIPRTWLAGALFVLFSSSSLHAQGVSIHSHSTCALARNSTGVAEPCADGSAVFYNPAALAFQRGVASAGAMALYTKAEFTFDDTGESFESEQGTKFAPHAWLGVRLTPRIGAGIGFWAPYGLSMSWPLAFEGRYVGYDNTLRGIYLQPTVAGQLIPGRLAVGAGLVVINGSVEIQRRIDLATTIIPNTNLPFSAIGIPHGTDFADLRLDVDDWAATFHVGLQFRASDRWSFGARYLHTAHLDLSGTADFTAIPTGLLLPAGNPFGLPAGTPVDVLLEAQFLPGAALSDQRLTTDLTLPNQFVVGVRFGATRRLDILVDYQWTGWEHFDEAVLEFANAPADTLFLDFKNTSTVRLAVDFAARERLALRAGVLYNTAAEPDVSVTPILPEAPRTSFAGGIGYRIADRFNLDLGVEILLQEDRRGRVRPRTSRSQTAADLNVGEYSAHGVFVGVTLSYLLGQRGERYR